MIEKHWSSSLEDKINERWDEKTKETNEMRRKRMGVGKFPVRRGKAEKMEFRSRCNNAEL